MKSYEFDAVLVGAAWPLPAPPSAPGWRGFLEALTTRLMRMWIGLYAAPPRHLPPLV